MDSIRTLKLALDDVDVNLRGLDVLRHVWEQAEAAWRRGDDARCKASLMVLGGMGGPLFGHGGATCPDDPAQWRSHLDQTNGALVEWERHMRRMRARLQDHLRDAGAGGLAWRVAVATTIKMQQRHLERMAQALSVRAENRQLLRP